MGERKHEKQRKAFDPFAKLHWRLLSRRESEKDHLLSDFINFLAETLQEAHRVDMTVCICISSSLFLNMSSLVIDF